MNIVLKIWKIYPGYEQFIQDLKLGKIFGILVVVAVAPAGTMLVVVWW